jgi:hypothetical protein
MPVQTIKQQLLCTFAPTTSLDLIFDYIKTYYQIHNGKVFVYTEVLENVPSSKNNYIIIYNIDKNLREEGLAKNTILVHRKKQSNSFYTINGLNNLIKVINNGVLDKTYQIDWNNYSNKLITGNGDDLKIIDIFFEKIIYI